MKEANLESCIRYDPTLEHFEKAKLWRQEKDLWVPGWGRGAQAEHRRCHDSDTTLYNAVVLQWWVRVTVHLYKPIVSRTRREEENPEVLGPSVNNNVSILAPLL